ncbi:pseudouridine synthase [Syntrophobotulus glycolicus]|nr:pseudouridine synthase [Syntrophobotulus glycolicus]
MRLQKAIALSGLASRRRAEEMMTEGRVKVNGVVVTELGMKVCGTDTIEVDGKTVQSLEVKGKENKVYYMLNKPVGVITSLRDPQGRKTVRDLLGDVKERVYPVGRLDYDTSGILLLTNDGDLAYRLTHPKFGVSKIYRVQTGSRIPPKSIEQLEKGLLLEDGWTAPAKVHRLPQGQNDHIVEITIHEGRNRQIRRMFERIGYPVQRLHRKSFGPLFTGELAPGGHRRLSQKEIRALKAAVGLSSAQ